MPLGRRHTTATLPDPATGFDGASFDFAGLMAPFAPFESRPHLAVAVSGGGDSMALALLAHDWARARGGCVTALTVDHGLRAEAAGEATQVAAWCRAHGIAHVILKRQGPVPASGIQAFARAARYALLEDWCRDHVVLHLFLAHQREDQAETVMMRQARASGLDGLAGMASIVERGAIRLLRPLLGTTRAQLRGFLVARGQSWIEDPSNRNPAFTRVRVRDDLGAALPGSAKAHLAATAVRLGRERAAREREEAQHLARFVTIDPAGFATIDPQAFVAPEALGAKLLGAVLTTISGGNYPPRGERLGRLYRELADGLSRDRTLGGCLVRRRPMGKARDKILICREPAAIAAPLPLAPGGDTRWDGRFRVTLGAAAPAGLWVGALGPDTPIVAREQRNSAALPLPSVVRATLPALRDAKGVVAVPTLGYFKCCREEAETAACRAEFGPIRSLTGAGFTIV
ncbi:MAG TPA: tRNA lysidine(34) synthetase TilS [Stellaceae bacterium]|jgi:tRNA(Ile)-lysidine synthase|nr:tRNA lysidine(34) synthetase TilS [Stellaceae bacterium]